MKGSFNFGIFAIFVVIFSCVVLITSMNSQAQALTGGYLSPKPMSQVINVKFSPVSATTSIKVPLITWGGDVATILADMDGIFKQEGLDVELFCENNFVKQVEMCLSGETPYIRGTMGMINAAADAFKAKGQELVVIYQLTWSNGGDAMTVRKGKDLKSIRTVALQLYGPHMDYAANLFSTVNRLKQVKFKWLQELTLPTFDTKGMVLDPVSAFQQDPTLDATMSIVTDALMLTSGGKEGTGAEGSVKGSTVLLTTQTANQIISDVYAVPLEYYENHRAEVQKFVKALMRAEEALRDLRKNKSSQQTKYKQTLSKAAEILLGAPQATADVEALLRDCKFVGHSGNVAFFTGKGTLRNFKVLTDEIQVFFLQMEILTSRIPLTAAQWDYNALASGLKYAVTSVASSGNVVNSTGVAPVKKFDASKVAASVEKQIAVEPSSWEEENTLFVVEIYFDPNQGEFSAIRYRDDFQKALEIAQTYAGAVVVIEGHTDPLAILKREEEVKRENDQIKKRQMEIELEQMKQVAKNLSLQRAEAVRRNFISFCGEQDIDVDESQFVAVGLGVTIPKYNSPRTKDEWGANRRVVFRIKQVEAELEEFTPIN